MAGFIVKIVLVLLLVALFGAAAHVVFLGGVVLLLVVGLARRFSGKSVNDRAEGSIQPSSASDSPIVRNDPEMADQNSGMNPQTCLACRKTIWFAADLAGKTTGCPWCGSKMHLEMQRPPASSSGAVEDRHVPPFSPSRSVVATVGVSHRDPSTGNYPRGAIEEPLAQALARIPDLPAPEREYKFKEGGRLVTVPDFAWPGMRLAVFCDGYAYHGNQKTLALDAKKRNTLTKAGWAILNYWGRTILKDPDRCAREIAETYRELKRKLDGAAKLSGQ